MTSRTAPPARPASRDRTPRNPSSTAGSAKAKASRATRTRPGAAGAGAADSSSAASDTRSRVAPSRANQPAVSKLGAWGITPARSTRPWVVRSPYRPQKPAGTRTDPPVSVPSAKSARPPATAAAEPEDEPPGTNPGAAGFRGVPWNGFSPRIPSETSSVIVLPTTFAPARSRRSTSAACRSGAGWVRPQSGFPPPVGSPATSKRSLTANVRPESGPPVRPGIRTSVPGTKAPRASPAPAAGSVAASSARGSRIMFAAPPPGPSARLPGGVRKALPE